MAMPMTATLSMQVRKITMPLYDAERVKKNANSANVEQEDGESASKKRKLEEETGVVDQDTNGCESSRVENENGGGEADVKPEKTFVTGVPLLTMPGHTGYLTFATLPATLPKKSDISDQVGTECSKPADGE